MTLIKPYLSVIKPEGVIYSPDTYSVVPDVLHIRIMPRIAWVCIGMCGKFIFISEFQCVHIVRSAFQGALPTPENEGLPIWEEINIPNECISQFRNIQAGAVYEPCCYQAHGNGLAYHTLTSEDEEVTDRLRRILRTTYLPLVGSAGCRIQCYEGQRGPCNYRVFRNDSGSMVHTNFKGSACRCPTCVAWIVIGTFRVGWIIAWLWNVLATLA